MLFETKVFKRSCEDERSLECSSMFFEGKKIIGKRSLHLIENLEKTSGDRLGL